MLKKSDYERVGYMAGGVFGGYEEKSFIKVILMQSED